MKKMRAPEAGNGAAINSCDCSEETISPGWKSTDAAVVITDIPNADKMSLFMMNNEMFHRKR